MRILHIPAAYPPVLGGAERLCQQVSEACVAKGHQVRVFTGDVGDVVGYYELGVRAVGIEQETLNGVEVRRFTFCGSAAYRLASATILKIPSKRVRGRFAAAVFRRIGNRFLQALANEIITFQPDVVMTMPHFVVNVQCVLQVHRTVPFPLVLLPLVHSDWPASIERDVVRVCGQADALVAVTNAENQYIQNEWKIPSDKVFTGLLGVDLPQVNVAAPRSSRVLFLSRKVPHKGIDRLVAAMRLVWRERPDARLILAGARTPETKLIDRMIGSLPQSESERVTSLDNVTENTKSELLATACCLVLPSLSESFGIVLLEAMAHQTPVVAFDLTVFREVVTSGEDGLLVPPDGPEGMAQAILFLLNNPTRAAEMGYRGREKVGQRFTWDQVTDRYLQAYEYAIAARRRQA